MNTIITIIIIIIIISNAIVPMAPDIMGTVFELAVSIVVPVVLMVLALVTVEVLVVVMLVWYGVTCDDSSLEIAAAYEDNTIMINKCYTY